MRQSFWSEPRFWKSRSDLLLRLNGIEWDGNKSMSRIFNVKLMSDDFLCMMPYLKMQFPSSSQLLMVQLCCFVLWVQTHLVVTRKLTLSLLNISEGVVYAMKKLVNHGCICDYAYNMGDAPAELSRKISGIAGICEISRRQQCSLFSAKHSFSIYWLRGKNSEQILFLKNGIALKR